MKLYTLGTSHGRVEDGRACSANLIFAGGKYYLFDCGGATELCLSEIGVDPTDVSAIFISHMHEDHSGGITAILKRFYAYNPGLRHTVMHLPDPRAESAIMGLMDVMGKFRWNGSRFETEYEAAVDIKCYHAGIVFDDGNLKVTAIPTTHFLGGQRPSYAFLIEAEEKRMLYTSDLDFDFSDYPKILYEQDFDLVLSELVHFDVEKNLTDIVRTRTKRLIFTHYSNRKLLAFTSAGDLFPFEVAIAEDKREFDV